MRVDPLRYVDAHCHLDHYRDAASEVRACESSQTYTIAVTNLPRTFAPMAALAAGCRYVRAAVGLHPALVGREVDSVSTLLHLIGTTKYVGEVGLDYTQADANERELQRRVLQQVFERCESAGGRVISVHSRGAAEDIVSLIAGIARSRVILHWFMGSATLAARALEAGCFFSINPAMMRSASGRRAIARIPDERLLTESDGPFVAFDGKPMRPSLMTELLPRLAHLRHRTPEEVRERILGAFREVVSVGEGVRA
jgi:TatD DNase family protein